MQKTILANSDDQLMVMAAHRYCLGRQTYIVSSCISWLSDNWETFFKATRVTIIKDNILAMMNDDVGSRYDFDGWRDFTNWAWNLIDEDDQIYIINTTDFRNKPWPLYCPEIVYRDDDEEFVLRGDGLYEMVKCSMDPKYTYRLGTLFSHNGSFKIKK